MTMSNNTYGAEHFSEGMRKLKTAALLQIIAWVLATAAVLVGYGAIFSLISASIGMGHEVEGPHELLPHLGLALGALIGVVVAGLASLVLALVSVYGYLIPAANKFAEYDRDRYGTVSTLLKVGFIGGAVAMLVGLLVVVAGGAAGLIGFVVVGAILLIVGLVLLLVGAIGNIILMFRLKDDTGEGLFLAAGILFIIAIFIGLAAIIAWILVYAAAKPELRPSRPAHTGSDILPPPPPA